MAIILISGVLSIVMVSNFSLSLKFSLFFMKEIDLEKYQKLARIVQENKIIGPFYS